MPCDPGGIFSHILVTNLAPASRHTGSVSTDPIRAAPAAPTTETPTTELVTGVVGDRCPNCQSPLAPDQRYCVNCGERRGRARFSQETLAAQTAPAAAAAAVPPRQPHRRLSSAATLVAGVATLLIALGVGVLIGHDSNTSTPARSAQVITVNGGGASTTASNTGSTGAAATHTTAATGHHKAIHAKPTVVHVTQKTIKAANAAAGKVLGGGASKNLSQNLQQSVGGSCSGGAGCQNGKFTGNFFPGG
jgi:hypothetical protein